MADAEVGEKEEEKREETLSAPRDGDTVLGEGEEEEDSDVDEGGEAEVSTPYLSDVGDGCVSSAGVVASVESSSVICFLTRR